MPLNRRYSKRMGGGRFPHQFGVCCHRVVGVHDHAAALVPQPPSMQGEAAAIKPGRLQYLTTFANPHAALVGGVPVPDGVLRVKADAVRVTIEVLPLPPRQPPVGTGPARVLPGMGALTAEGWEQVAPLLPVRQARPGRRANAERHYLEGMLWVMATGNGCSMVSVSRKLWILAYDVHTLSRVAQGWHWPQVVTILGSGTGVMHAAA